jgi:molybdopterin-dependent oxidoreductase alpha subunit
MGRRFRHGGGFPAIFYTLSKALEVGPLKLWQRMRSRNACKTCALGMGGMAGGMVNEQGHFPEVCKKSLQAQVGDMKGALPIDFFDRHPVQELLRLTPKQAEDAGRLIYPVVLANRGERFQATSWEAAMEASCAALRSTSPERVAFYSSGRSSNEAAFLLQSFARVYGSNHVMNCSFYCHQASGVALKQSLGTGTATVTLDDLSQADLVFLIGANPASNHPRLMTQLGNLRARGGQVIVVNPILESGLERFHIPSQLKSLIFGTKIPSLYVQPIAGGDLPFLVGLLKAIVESGHLNQQFLSEYAENVEEALAYASSLPWERLVAESGVSREQMEQAANMLADAKSTIFAWAMGLTHHAWGVQNILALCNLAIATGHLGRRGAGLMPIRGHSNVQGVGSVGFTPQLQDAVATALVTAYGTPMPVAPGYDTDAMMHAADSGKVDVLFALGGNLWGSNPDSRWATAAMSKIKTVIYLSTKLNPGHFHGRGETTLILPVLARDEEAQPTTQESMFNFVRLSEGGTANLSGQMRAESEVICDLANRVLGTTPVDWNKMRDHRAIRKLIAEVIPGWKELGDIDETKREFTIEGRIFHQPRFKTASGKAIMHKTELPQPLPDCLRLITIRSEGQFNTVVYEEHDLYRGVPHRHCIIVSQPDADRLNLRDGQRVRVRGEAGEMDNIELFIGRISKGSAAMYFPEANVLIRARLDPLSKTPAFKSAPIWIEAPC